MPCTPFSGGYWAKPPGVSSLLTWWAEGHQTQSLRASQLPPLCRMSHGSTHPLLMWPAPARETPLTGGHNELDHAPTRKTDNSVFFTNSRGPGCGILSQEGLLQCQKGQKNVALLPSSLFYWYTMTCPTIKAIANLFLPGRWAKGPKNRQKSWAMQPNKAHRAPQSLPRACTEE